MRVLLLATALWLVATPALAKLKVVATLSDLGSIAEVIGGDRVKVDTIVDGRFDPHAVEILPSYMLKVSKADIFLQVGLDLEIWAPQIIQGARNRKLTVVHCSHDIQLLGIPEGPVDASHGDIHIHGNPHIWLDPRNGVIIAENIAQAFIRKDPEGADGYRARLAAFEATVEARMADWKSRLAAHPGLDLVYFHDSWPYFNQAFGIDAAGFVEPKPGVSPSPRHTAELIAMIQERNVPIVALAPFQDRGVCESIERETGAKLVVLASSVGAFDGVDDYLSVFEANISRILAAVESP